jgi:hypothetical protein
MAPGSVIWINRVTGDDTAGTSANRCQEPGLRESLYPMVYDFSAIAEKFSVNELPLATCKLSSLAGSRGLVPARYSCRLVMPSPSLSLIGILSGSAKRSGREPVRGIVAIEQGIDTLESFFHFREFVKNSPLLGALKWVGQASGSVKNSVKIG